VGAIKGVPPLIFYLLSRFAPVKPPNLLNRMDIGAEREEVQCGAAARSLRAERGDQADHIRAREPEKATAKATGVSAVDGTPAHTARTHALLARLALMTHRPLGPCLSAWSAGLWRRRP